MNAAQRLAELMAEFAQIERALADPAVFADATAYAKLSRRHRELQPLVLLMEEQSSAQAAAAGARELLRDAASDAELRELASAELAQCEAKLLRLEEEISLLLQPSDPLDEAEVILEIRAGTGGAEAALFASDLLRLYQKHAEANGLSVALLESSESDLGGLSKVVAEIGGGAAYRHFRWESGVHRVQRVPATESQGRIHTSTATVAVLPKSEENAVQIDQSEIRTDVFRSQGAGGQSVNTTDSAVRLTYRAGTPEEIVVICQDGRSQHKNRERAMIVLASRLAERERERLQASERAARSAQIGGGERSEKIRTYNFPQNRLTDHRLSGEGKNSALDSVLSSNLNALVSALGRAAREDELLSEEHS